MARKKNNSASEKVIQLFPEKKEVPLERLYLDQRLAGLSTEIGRPLVVTAYVTDRNGIVANRDEKKKLQVPPELKNPSDWRLFQELMAQSDVVISGSAYLKRVIASGSRAEDILFQFQPGNKFEELGQWRLEAGFMKRQPDLVFLSHRLDFQFPEGLSGSDRNIFVFTTYTMANSKEAGALADAGAVVVGSGETGVDGARLIDYLGMGPDYHVIMMATGPSVLDLLLAARRLDLLYVTEVQREIPFDDPADIRMMLPEGKKAKELEEFALTHRYSQGDITAEDGSPISQEFHRYDRKGLLLN